MRSCRPWVSPPVVSTVARRPWPSWKSRPLVTFVMAPRCMPLRGPPWPVVPAGCRATPRSTVHRPSTSRHAVRLPNGPVLTTTEETRARGTYVLIIALTAVAACVAAINCPAAAGTILRGADTCFGQQATVLDTAADEDFVGTQGVDVIVAAGGNDTIVGRGGDDLLCGGPGRDEIDGGQGIIGGTGNDRIDGGPGRDLLMGYPGRDQIRGGGNDELDGGAGRDRRY